MKREVRENRQGVREETQEDGEREKEKIYRGSRCIGERRVMVSGGCAGYGEREKKRRREGGWSRCYR